MYTGQYSTYVQEVIQIIWRVNNPVIFQLGVTPQLAIARQRAYYINHLYSIYCTAVYYHVGCNERGHFIIGTVYVCTVNTCTLQYMLVQCTLTNTYTCRPAAG